MSGPEYVMDVELKQTVEVYLHRDSDGWVATDEHGMQVWCETKEEAVTELIESFYQNGEIVEADVR